MKLQESLAKPNTPVIGALAWVRHLFEHDLKADAGFSDLTYFLERHLKMDEGSAS